MSFQSRNKSSQIVSRDKSQQQLVSILQSSKNLNPPSLAKSQTSSNFHGQSSSLLLNFNQKNSMLIPKSEIERMKESSLLHINSEQDQRLKERQLLLDISKKRVENWPNTIHAIRKKKDETRFEKFKNEEEQRRLVDEQEAVYQANVKRGILEKSNKQIYEGSDRVKAFQSKMLLVDAIQEREGQVDLKKQIKEIEKAREEIHKQQIQESLQKQEEEDQQRKEELEEKKRQTQKLLKEQYDELKQNCIKRLLDDKLEGEIIKQRALEAIAKEKEAEKMRKAKMIQTQLDSKKGNEYLHQIKLQLKEKELLEDEKIKEYAKKKENIAEMRKIREDMRFHEKQQQRQKLIDVQIKRLAEVKNQEDHRINKQIIEAQMKADESEQRKRDAIVQQKKRFDESIKLTLARKEEQAVVIKQEDKAYQDFWAHKNIQIHEKEKQEKLDAYHRAKNLQDFHADQAAQKQQLRESQFIVELDEAEKIKQRLETDDKNFNSWAERMIQEWHQEGKEIKPLLKELVEYKKRV